MNSVQLIGHVGGTPDIKEVGKDNIKIAEFSIAVRRSKEETDWINCKAWRDNASFIQQYVKKGSQIGISGRLTEETWQDKQTGEKRRKHLVTVTSVTLCGSKDGDSKPSNTTKDIAQGSLGDDECPF